MSLRQLIYRWPLKLAALFLAALAWYFVNLNSITVTQRSFTVPVTVEGIAENAVPSDVPETVEIAVSGPSVRVARLEADRFDATLNLTGVSGDYQRPIEVLVPQGIDLLSSIPAEAIGTVEAISNKQVPLEVAMAGEAEDALFTPEFSPVEVSVRGRTSVLEQVARIVGTAAPTSGEHVIPLYALDEGGKPVTDAMLTLEPSRITVVMQETPILRTKMVPLSVSQPDTSPLLLSTFTLSQNTLNVAGSRDALEGLAEVSGSVELDTPGLQAGEYTLVVTPQLPENVAALETVTAELVLGNPETDTETSDTETSEAEDSEAEDSATEDSAADTETTETETTETDAERPNADPEEPENPDPEDANGETDDSSNSPVR